MWLGKRFPWQQHPITQIWHQSLPGTRPQMAIRNHLENCVHAQKRNGPILKGKENGEVNEHNSTKIDNVSTAH